MDIKYTNVPMTKKFCDLRPGSVFTPFGQERPMLVLENEFQPSYKAVDLSNGKVESFNRDSDIVPLIATLVAKPQGT